MWQPMNSSAHQIEWINTLKLCTMILVILGHCTYCNVETAYGGLSLVDNNVAYCLIYRIAGIIVGYIYTFHMPLFISISGMCYFYSEKHYLSLKQLLLSKSKRLLVPFFFVTICYSIPIKYIVGYWSKSNNVFIDIFKSHILLCGNSHLWYLVSLFWIFVLFYLLKNVLKLKLGGGHFSLCL